MRERSLSAVLGLHRSLELEQFVVKPHGSGINGIGWNGQAAMRDGHSGGSMLSCQNSRH